MTGFGRGQAREGTTDIEVEIRAVNHKGLDVKLKAPRETAAIEAALLKRIRAKVTRGRVDVSVRIVREELAFAPTLDATAADHLLDQLRAYTQERGLAFDIGAKDLLRAKELFGATKEEIPEEEISAASTSAVDAALDSFARARAVEGEGLKQTLLSHVDHCGTLVDKIEEKLKGAPQTLAERLRTKVAALDDAVTLDPARLAQEVALLAERVDVTEELNRLRMHQSHAKDLIEAEIPVGRKLDFLCQEFLREANTIASKCQDAEAAHLVVDLKAEVEKLREQVQNAE